MLRTFYVRPLFRGKLHFGHTLTLSWNPCFTGLGGWKPMLTLLLALHILQTTCLKLMWDQVSHHRNVQKWELSDDKSNTTCSLCSIIRRSVSGEQIGCMTFICTEWQFPALQRYLSNILQNISAKNIPWPHTIMLGCPLSSLMDTWGEGGVINKWTNRGPHLDAREENNTGIHL